MTLTTTHQPSPLLINLRQFFFSFFFSNKVCRTTKNQKGGETIAPQPSPRLSCSSGQLKVKNTAFVGWKRERGHFWNLEVFYTSRKQVRLFPFFIALIVYQRWEEMPKKRQEIKKTIRKKISSERKCPTFHCLYNPFFLLINVHFPFKC